MLDATSSLAASFALFVAASPSPVFLLETVPPVTDLGFIKWAIEQGGLVVAFCFVLYFYRKDTLANAEEKKLYIAAQRETIDKLMTTLDGNTRAMERLTAAIDDSQNERFPPRSRVSFNPPIGGKG
jgi:hypothetical protein